MLRRISLLIFAVIIVGQLYLLREGRKTLTELEKLKELSEQRVDSLRLANDSLDIFTDVLVVQVDSISKLSSNELTEYFSNRYNNN